MRFNLLLLAIIFSSPVSANSDQELMEKLLTVDGKANIQVSANIVRVSDAKVLYSLNPNLLLSPASTTKILLGAALLAKLSPEFRMQTRFFSTGPRQGGKIQGDLVVLGGGDPLLVSEDLFAIAAEMKLSGIKEFSGDLVVDNSLFMNDKRAADLDSDREDSTHAYDAPISALGINFNSVTIVVSPGQSIGEKAIVATEPFPLSGLIIENKVKTVARGMTQIRVERRSGEAGAVRIIAEGQIRLASPLVRYYRSMPQPVFVAGEYVRSFLLAFGITVRGRVKEGKLPTNAALLLSHDSKPLAELLRSLNAFSSNYMADVLFKRLVAEKKQVGSFGEGAKILGSFLNELGVPGPFVLQDGSGLSSGTRLSAEQLTKTLSYVANDFQIFPDFLASLPRPGASGSLKNRFQDSETIALKGMLRAKTGTLSEPVIVSGLAGYCNHPTYGLVAFAILQNGKETLKQPALKDLHLSQEKALAFFVKKFRG